MGVAVQQRDAPVEALELKMLQAPPAFINVRLAGDPDCSTDNGGDGDV
jgi:hypothetical protein